MLLLAAVLSAALVSPGDAGVDRVPFPRPQGIQVTAATKCDFGTVLSVERARGTMQGSTRAGVITYLVGPDVLVFAKGQPAGGMAAVTVGAAYRAYYVLDGGARVQEIDLE